MAESDMEHMDRPTHSLEYVIGSMGAGRVEQEMRGLALYNAFTRQEWSRLRADMPMTLSEDDLKLLRGQNENVSFGPTIPRSIWSRPMAFCGPPACYKNMA